jgi:hypothetical protein
VLDRIAGASSEVNALKDALNRGKIAIPDVSTFFPEYRL